MQVTKQVYKKRHLLIKKPITKTPIPYAPPLTHNPQQKPQSKSNFIRRITKTGASSFNIIVVTEPSVTVSATKIKNPGSDSCHNDDENDGDDDDGDIIGERSPSRERPDLQTRCVQKNIKKMRKRQINRWKQKEKKKKKKEKKKARKQERKKDRKKERKKESKKDR